jgi:predicted aldo/keto reductase-like oxidoreductase
MPAVYTFPPPFYKIKKIKNLGLSFRIYQEVFKEVVFKYFTDFHLKPLPFDFL